MAVIKLKIDVADVSNVLLLYDRLRVFRSISGESGPFEAITAATAQPASIYGVISAPFSVQGLTFSISVNGGSVQTVTFFGPNPFSVDAVIQELENGITGVQFSEDGGKLVLQSVATGTAASLEITGGTAVAVLGLETIKESGLDANIVLQVGQSRYEYDDQNGDPDYWYRTQYYNSTTFAVSSYSAGVQGALGAVISSSLLITGQVRLVDLSGKPLSGRRIVCFLVDGYPLIVENHGVFGHSVEATTDAAGYAEIPLIRGSVVDVAFTGTALVRRIVVPSTGETFDLFSSVSQADDNFQLQIPVVTDAIRRS